MITSLLRSSGAVSEVDAFPRNVGDIAALLHPDGASLGLHSGQIYEVRATPRAAGTPTVWLLGSSEYSANLAASEGMPDVFANHFQGDGTTLALDTYRRKFRPSELLAEPRTFLTVNVSVADTIEEAYALALPQLQQMARLRSGQTLSALATVEEAAATRMPPTQHNMIDLMAKNWVIGAPAPAAARIRDLAAKFGVDEVMIGPEASARDDADPTTSPDRVRALELLADQLLAEQLLGE